MRWLEISVQVDHEAAETISEVFNRYGHGGAVIEQTLEQNEVASLVVKTFLPQDGREAHSRRLIEQALWHLGQLYPVPLPQVRELAEEDWAEAWKQGYHLQRVGQRLVIKPPWETCPSQQTDVVIEMEPGLAFGTGLHPTTRQCLLELEARLSPGLRMLDVGTGTGILAIAAAKLGAGSVLALDTDPVAVEVARRNVAANGAADVVRVVAGTLDVTHGSWDLVVVNILAQAIIEMAGAISAALKPGGLFVVAGLLDTQEAQVTEALQAVGLSPLGRRQDGDWVAVTGRRL